VEIFNSNC